MTVSALVITLAPGAPPLHVADPRLELGEPQGVHVPATLETETTQEAVGLFEALLALPSVQSVEVVRIDFEEAGA